VRSLLATKDEEAQRDLKEVQQSLHLIQSPAGLLAVAVCCVCDHAQRSAALPSREWHWPSSRPIQSSSESWSYRVLCFVLSCSRSHSLYF
jgi:hypothetical protein